MLVNDIPLHCGYRSEMSFCLVDLGFFMREGQVITMIDLSLTGQELTREVVESRLHYPQPPHPHPPRSVPIPC